MSEAREDEDEASVASALRPLGGVGGKFLAHGGDGLVSEGGGTRGVGRDFSIWMASGRVCPTQFPQDGVPSNSKGYLNQKLQEFSKRFSPLCISDTALGAI